MHSLTQVLPDTTQLQEGDHHAEHLQQEEVQLGQVQASEFRVGGSDFHQQREVVEVGPDLVAPLERVSDPLLHDR
jgi:hypothetical protein